MQLTGKDDTVIMVTLPCIVSYLKVSLGHTTTGTGGLLVSFVNYMKRKVTLLTFI